MVDTAPLPPDFPPGDTPPVRVPHPMEGWALEPGQPLEPTVRRELYPSGHLTATVTALRKLEEGEAHGRRLAGAIIHPTERARLQREQEREQEEAAEIERKSRNSGAVLRAAHRLKVEALVEVDRLASPVERARQLVADLETRAREHEAVTAAHRVAAAEALLTTGESVLPLVEALNIATESAIAAELATARAALQQLEAQAKAAGDRLVRCGHGVSRCAIAVLIDQAVDEASAIIADEAKLHQRRADLDSLSRLLTTEGARLNAQPPRLPAQVSRAIYPADRILTGADRDLVATDWAAAYRALCEAPGEVEAG